MSKPNPELVMRAASALVAHADAECNFYEAQLSVEHWSFDALELALAGRNRQAAALLNRYEPAPWSHADCPEGSRHDADDPTKHRISYEYPFKY